MAKYYVTCKCGHEIEVELFGKVSDREKKLEWYANNDCKACYARAQATDCEEVTMSYADYKNNYSDCKTVPNSYDKSTKTIVVLVQKAVEETVEEITIEDIAEETTTPIAIIKSMISDTAANLDSALAKVQAQFDSLATPTEAQIKHIANIYKTVDLVKRFKAQ